MAASNNGTTPAPGSTPVPTPGPWNVSCPKCKKTYDRNGLDAHSLRRNAFLFMAVDPMCPSCSRNDEQKSAQVKDVAARKIAGLKKQLGVDQLEDETELAAYTQATQEVHRESIKMNKQATNHALHQVTDQMEQARADARLGFPSSFFCPRCRRMVQTESEYVNGSCI